MHNLIEVRCDVERAKMLAEQIFVNSKQITDIENSELDALVKLVADGESITSLIREIINISNKTLKRVENFTQTIRNDIQTEVSNLGGKVILEDYELVIKRNPPRVVIEDLEKVPRKYRLEPKPIPPWESWPVDKNSVKQAILKEMVQSINGVILESSERLEIKQR